MLFAGIRRASVEFLRQFWIRRGKSRFRRAAADQLSPVLCSSKGILNTVGNGAEISPPRSFMHPEVALRRSNSAARAHGRILVLLGMDLRNPATSPPSWGQDNKTGYPYTHVTFVDGVNPDGTFTGLGGNQSGGQLTRSTFNASGFDFRDPQGAMFSNATAAA